MKGWRAIGAIIGLELRREWGGILLTSFFALYFGAIFTGITSRSPQLLAENPLLSGMMDWVYLFGFPLFGCMMNRTIFNYWRNDPFTKRIAHWRTLPIPLPTIIRARYVQAAVMMTAIGGIFMALQYMLNPYPRELANPGEWIAVSLVWLAYGMTVQTGYIFMELGFSGKTFVKWYLFYSALMLLLAALASWRNISLFKEVLQVVANRPIALPPVALAIAAAALWAGHRLTLFRMRRRRYTF